LRVKPRSPQIASIRCISSASAIIGLLLREDAAGEVVLVLQPLHATVHLPASQ
jgi:hypothetical protein